MSKVDSRSDCLIMAKPAGPGCNMCCDYCYYLNKKSLFPTESWQMSESILERYIAERFETSPGPHTHFEWHGGEPTLMGVEYFRTITRLQQHYKPEGRTFSNGLQTNGLLIDDEWADFLSQEKFSVGISLDGPKYLHDRFRKTGDNRSTFDQVIQAFKILKQRRVFCNVLCVLHSENTIQPDKLYDFFKTIGVQYLQFLPLVSTGEASVDPGDVGKFLCRIFDRWIAEDVGRMVIQIFDEALRTVYGIPHALCIHRKTCGDVVVLEHNGNVYACDHFTDTEHLIGNILNRNLSDLLNDPDLIAFGNAKRDTLPRMCTECEVLSFCNGGCPKDRISITSDGETGLNSLCLAYKSIFLHARPELIRLAAHMKAQKPLRTFKSIQSEK